MFTGIKAYLNFLPHKWRYPHAQIEFGALVEGNSVLGDGVRINRGAFVSASSLPGNVIIDRDCYVYGSQFERYVKLMPGCRIYDIEIGAYSYMGRDCLVSKTKIGRFCCLGYHVACGLGDHPTNFISVSPVFYSTAKQSGVSFADREYFQERKEIFIGNDVWIANMVFIRDGVSIGNGAIIAAGAVVTKDVPDYAIVGGVPAKLIRYRFSEDIIRKLLEIQWWNWDETKLRAAQPYFVRDDPSELIHWAFESGG